MKPVEKTSEDLFQKLRNRFSPIEMGDENAESTTDPAAARIFSFMYKEGDNEVGFVSISIVANRSFKVYYGTDVADRVENKASWYNFLRDLRMFAKRNLMSFDARDLAKNQLEPRDFKFISNQDGTYKDHEVEVSESAMFGSRRKSYQTMENVKMIVNHRKSIDETIPGARSRYIESIYLERADGERYKFPYNYLTGARAMARHVNEGGTPYDDMGKHIVGMIKEMRDLSKFARRTKKHAMEDESANDVRSKVVERFHSMKKQLGAMSVKEGYARFAEGFKADEPIVEDDAMQQIKERFTQQVFDTQLEDTLPAVMKALKEAEMNQLAEADKSIAHLIQSKPLVLRKDDSADQMFKSTKFTDGAGLLGFIMSDIAGRIIGAGADEIANFASDAAERMQDRDYDQNDKQLAMRLAKKYMDDVKKMAANPEYAAEVRVDPKEIYGAKKKRTGGFHEAEAFESWATELVPEDYDRGANTVSKAARASGDRARKPSNKAAMTKMANKYANKAVTGMDPEQLPEAKNPELKRLIQNYAGEMFDAQEYAYYGDDDMSQGYEDSAAKILELIRSKFGDQAAQHAIRAANPNFSDYNKGDSLSGGLRRWLDNKVTKAGKINKNTQKAMKNPDNHYLRKVGGPKGKLPESQVNENWNDNDHSRLDQFIAQLEAKGYKIEGIMHWGYSDWKSSGDEPPHAELTIVDTKTGKKGSAYWPKGAKQKYFGGNVKESSFYRPGERTGSAEGAKNAIMWRIQRQHMDLVEKYGLDKVMQAVEDEAMYLDNLEEIGSSDISAWVNNIKRNLAADYPDKEAAVKEAGTVGTTGTVGPTGNAVTPAQAMRDPKLQQNAKNVSRVAQAAGLKTNPNQVAQTLAAQASGKPLSPQNKATSTNLGNTMMQAAANDPKKAAQLTAMMKKMTQ